MSEIRQEHRDNSVMYCCECSEDGVVVGCTQCERIAQALADLEARTVERCAVIAEDMYSTNIYKKEIYSAFDNSQSIAKAIRGLNHDR